MSRTTIASSRDHSGNRCVADLGVVFRGELWRMDCTVSLEIEEFHGTFFAHITVAHSRPGQRRSVIIRWPYSRSSEVDLVAVVADLRSAEAGADGHCLSDPRGAFGRLLDRLLGNEYLGLYTFRSVVDHTPATTVSAELVRTRGVVTVRLVERRRSRGFSSCQIPHAAVAPIRAALESWTERR